MFSQTREQFVFGMNLGSFSDQFSIARGRSQRNNRRICEIFGRNVRVSDDSKIKMHAVVVSLVLTRFVNKFYYFSIAYFLISICVSK